MNLSSATHPARSRLTPAQESALTMLKQALAAGNLVVFTSDPGRGRTTILRHLHQETGGAFIGSKEFLDSTGARHSLALEEALLTAVTAALETHDIVYVDDVHLVLLATHGHYPRGQYMETPMHEL